MKCLFNAAIKNVKTNEEYAKVLQKRIPIFILGIIVIVIICSGTFLISGLLLAKKDTALLSA